MPDEYLLSVESVHFVADKFHDFVSKFILWYFKVDVVDAHKTVNEY